MERRSYPSDLREQEWARLSPLIPPAKAGGYPRTTNMREVMNALLYLDRTGCQCEPSRMSFRPGQPCGKTIAHGRATGTWKRMHTALREAVRGKAGHQPTKSAAIIDSQEVQTTQKGCKSQPSTGGFCIPVLVGK